MAWNRGVILGSNAGGSSGGGGSPTGAAGGELAGTYPNPTITDGVIDDANIVAAGLTNAALSATAAIAASKLAAIPESGVTNLVSDLAIALASGSFKIGPHTYANIYPGIWVNQSAQQSSGDARYVRVTMEETGHLRDVSFYIATANAGNSLILVLDTGQANATHTTCTCLAISGNLSGASAGWMTYDPNLAVTKGDTLYLCIKNPDTTIKFATTGALVAAGLTLLPNSSFLPSSGAGTTAQKASGNILSANVPAAVNGTVTDANMGNVPATTAGVVWRIS